MSHNGSLSRDGAHIDADDRHENGCMHWSRPPGVSVYTKMCITVLAALPLLAIGDSSAADATERTVMPDFCSRRDVNCVLPDATGSRVVGTPSVPLQPIESTQRTPARAGFTQSGSAASTTTVVIQPDASGVTTVVTPSLGGVPNILPAPALPASPAVTSGGPASRTTSSSTSSASGAATSSGSISSGSTATTASGTTSGGAGFGDR